MRLLLVEEVLDPDREGDVPLSQAERKALLERIRRGDRAIDENRELKDRLRPGSGRAAPLQVVRRCSPPPTEPPRRREHPIEPRVLSPPRFGVTPGPRGLSSVTRVELASAPSPTLLRYGSPSSTAPTAALASESRSRSGDGRSPTFRRRPRSSSMSRTSRATTARDVIGEWKRKPVSEDAGRYGFSLVAPVVQLRLLGLSTSKIADYLEGAHGIHLSTAAVLKMERWAADSVAPLYEALKAQVADQPVVHADETKFPDRQRPRVAVGVLAPRGGRLSDRSESRPGRRARGSRRGSRDDSPRWLGAVQRRSDRQAPVRPAPREPVARAQGDRPSARASAPASGRRSEADGGGSTTEGVPRLRGRGSRAAAPLHRVVRARHRTPPMGSTTSSTPRCGG